LEKIQSNFTEFEQQLYVSSFYCYLNYNQENDYIVDLDNIWKWLGFSTKQNAKTVLLKNFVADKDYKSLPMQLHSQDKAQHGGHNKESILLNVKTFKLLCIKSATSRANEIHNYFVKLELLLHEVVKEESEELRQQLQLSNERNQQLENQFVEIETQNLALKTQNEFEKHAWLCQHYEKKRLVYIMKLETLDNGKTILKVGHTTEVRQRCQSISAFFGIKVILLDAFPCDFCYEFEQFLHRQPVLVKHKYNGLINKSKKSNEAYLISDSKSYRKIKDFIRRNIYRFNTREGSEDTYQHLEHLSHRLCRCDGCSLCRRHLKVAAINAAFEMYKDDKVKLEEIIDKIVSGNQEVKANEVIEQTNEVIEETNQDIIENENHKVEETDTTIVEQIPISRPNSYSPKVQIYDPNDLSKVINVFDSITEATRQMNGTSYTHIKYASRHRTLYKGFRWNLVNSNISNPFDVVDIGRTIATNEKKSGVVAMLNLDKTKVIRLFLLQKEAAKFCNVQPSVICNAINYNSPIGGHYFASWDNLDETLHIEYMRTNELPILLKKPKGLAVQKINPQTNEMECEYPSIADATKDSKISPKSIKKSSYENVAIGGWKWKIV
jgi:hypothetical protein